jgi:hypothetical protein
MKAHNLLTLEELMDIVQWKALEQNTLNTALDVTMEHVEKTKITNLIDGKPTVDEAKAKNYTVYYMQAFLSVRTSPYSKKYTHPVVINNMHCFIHAMTV